MTIGGWLRERAAAPPQLTSRIVDVMGQRLEASAAGAPEALLDGAERLLGDLVDRPSSGRESALDLLTVDALVTYALEAASASPGLLPGRAEDAMRRLARLATA